MDEADDFDGEDSIKKTVAVRVVHAGDPPGVFSQPTGNDTKTTADGGGFWCVPNVYVPGPVTAGGQFTLYAWVPPADPTATVQPNSQPFEANGTDSAPRDCCAEATCSSGSGSGGMQANLTAELLTASELLVTVSSGPHAGEHRATAVASRKWDVTIGGVPYTLVCVESESMTFHGPSASAPSLTFEPDPFSATFPGDLLDADDEIVVIVA